MYDLIGMHVLQTKEDASCKEAGLLLSEPMFPTDMVPQIPARHKIQDQVEGIAILKGLTHVDDEVMLQQPQMLSFIPDGLAALLAENPK